jgi:hypothetical protein
VTDLTSAYKLLAAPKSEAQHDDADAVETDTDQGILPDANVDGPEVAQTKDHLDGDGDGDTVECAGGDHAEGRRNIQVLATHKSQGTDKHEFYGAVDQITQDLHRTTNRLMKLQSDAPRIKKHLCRARLVTALRDVHLAVPNTLLSMMERPCNSLSNLTTQFKALWTELWEMRHDFPKVDRTSDEYADFCKAYDNLMSIMVDVAEENGMVARDDAT